MLRTEYIDVDFNLKLQKDLQEDEVICPHCGGTGLQVGDNPFGLRSKEQYDYKNPFPHKKQTIVGCQHCYNGVQNKCIHCGEILDLRKYQCDCEKAKQARATKQYENNLDKWDKAKKITLKKAIEKYVMVYIDDYDEFVTTDTIEDWLADKEEVDKKSLRIYGTYAVDLSINASSIIEDACSDLHENAMDNISNKDEKELQDLLNQWCEKNKSGTTTYYADYKVGIQLKKEGI